MRYVICCLVVLMCVGCGRHEEGDIDPAFYGYVVNFKAEAASRNTYVSSLPLTVRFVDEFPKEGNDRTVGMCHLRSRSLLIEIEKETWKNFGPEQRELLIYHELAHCLLHRKHVEGSMADGTPYSVMNPMIFSGSIYASHKAYYLLELFAGAH